MISYLSHESPTKGNAKCVQCSVLNLTVVFVKFFFPLIEVYPILEKHTFWFFPLY